MRRTIMSVTNIIRTDKQNRTEDDFYNRLDTINESIPRKKQKIIPGDFNARVGREDVFGPTREILRENSNDNGPRLTISFATRKEIMVVPTKKKHPETHDQIDYVIVDKQIKHWIRDVRSRRKLGSHSDHFLVRAV